ncbi:DsbC family protein [Conchiformibius steedae DSM 2580]|uniref:Thiol:disulfide interchange protein n=1 Tax=Conchiformibius steedae DSM 2580 TaxID=1121352 RepID=A0AAE9HSJ5_9NEIS|nr:DsbC family protein [Conchiformibius steedae]QMT32708.1 DsbC family protein [Conchiformibius steedae]URD67317.1 DsbC family protein [Conchiformibius steedae DSM 2580]
MKTKTSLRTLIPALILAMTACGEVPAASGKAASSPVAAAAKKAAVSAGEGVPADVAKTIAATLEKNYADQGLKIQNVASTPMAGVYEVQTDNRQIVYTDATGQYMIVGDLIRTQDGTSLTEERRAELSAIDFDSLPLNKAIREVRGNGKYKVAVFSDPDCPFCKRLEREFDKMSNVTIYTFLMPIPTLHPKAYQKSVQIWCQPNRTQAWIDWMRQGKNPPKVADCKNPVEDAINLGLQYGFNGTPTMVFPNGKVQGGYAPMPQLETLIQANQKK